jgi:hypothetical protein
VEEAGALSGARAICAHSRVEVGAERGEVDGHLRGRVRAVDDRRRGRAARRASDDLLQGRTSPVEDVTWLT